jgi:DNA-binding transcriptional ArsR family regulator
MVQQSAEAPALELDRIFHALSDPTRRTLLVALAGGEQSVSELAAPFDMSLTAVSKHLRVLEAARLVERERRGREQRCRLVPEPMTEAWQWIDHYRTFWSDRLDALDRYLEDRSLKDRRTTDA